MGTKYTKEEEDVFEQRVIEYIKKKPNASRRKVSDYAGVGIAVLERLEKNGNFVLPKPMTSKQVRKLHGWTDSLNANK
tara:strand:- start:145 stop:378 length:234 start_codon:yes stop_codon:yes gene_type:complete